MKLKTTQAPFCINKLFVARTTIKPEPRKTRICPIEDTFKNKSFYIKNIKDDHKVLPEKADDVPVIKDNVKYNCFLKKIAKSAKKNNSAQIMENKTFNIFSNDFIKIKKKLELAKQKRKDAKSIEVKQSESILKKGKLYENRLITLDAYGAHVNAIKKSKKMNNFLLKIVKSIEDKNNEK